MTGNDGTGAHGADELTAEERAALAALPREREPGRLLEERTVRALREAGWVEAPRRRRIAFPRHWLAAGVAAGVALFTGGLSLGQYMGARAAERALAEERARSSEQAAALVRATGTAYVAALSSFARLADTARGPKAEQGRQAAKQLLHAAASEVARIDPNDPVATGILAGFERAPKGAVADSAREGRKVVWF
jgi:hypothetical protein